MEDFNIKVTLKKIILGLVDLLLFFAPLAYIGEALKTGLLMIPKLNFSFMCVKRADSPRLFWSAIIFVGIMACYCFSLLYKKYIKTKIDKTVLDTPSVDYGKPTEQLLDKLKNSHPRCLAKFNLKDYTSPQKWNQGYEFTTKLILCSCGNSKLKLLVTPKKIMRGLFLKQEDVSFLAPLYVYCPVCDLQELLFNPEIHGHDGEENGNASMVGNCEPQFYSLSAGGIIVNYSYQGLENYEELIEDGISNPEDYFDSFTAYFVEEGEKTKDIVSYECA